MDMSPWKPSGFSLSVRFCKGKYNKRNAGHSTAHPKSLLLSINQHITCVQGELWNVRTFFINNMLIISIHLINKVLLSILSFDFREQSVVNFIIREPFESENQAEYSCESVRHAGASVGIEKE